MRVLLILALLISSGGCIAHMHEGVVKGVELSADLSATIRPGMDEASIVAVLGPPRSRNSKGSTTTLRYVEVFQQGVCRPYILFVPLGPSGKRKTQLHLVLEDDTLVKAWADVFTGNNRTTQWLFGQSNHGGNG